jgi:MoxR-like ATPase
VVDILFHGGGKQFPEPELPPPLEPVLRNQGAYVPSEALQHAISVALLLGQPLLLTGEPGTGKTTVAAALAHERFNNRLLQMEVKSTTAREDLLYRIDEMARFRDAQPQRKPRPLLEYLELRPLGQAIVYACGPEAPLLEIASGTPVRGNEAFLGEVTGENQRRPLTARDLLRGAAPPDWHGPTRWVVLIDEIDKAPRDTPNDLLEELEQMSFGIPELGLRVRPMSTKAPRPVVVITSNSEKSLPEPFLRRCAYHHIAFPSDQELRRIIASRLGDAQLEAPARDQLLRLFEAMRQKLRRRPSTSELLHWLHLIATDEDLRGRDDLRGEKEALKHFVGVLAKLPEDLPTAERAIDDWALHAE